MSDRIKFLQDAFRRGYDVETTYVGCVRITEKFEDQMVWDGIVDIFNVNGHPNAKRGYGWRYEENRERQYATVLGVHPVDSPLEAVRAFIASKSKD